MSSSSSTLGQRRRVLRGDTAPTQADAVLALDLAPAGLARLNPARVDAAVAEGREAGYQVGLAEGRADAEAAHASRLLVEAQEHRTRLAAVVRAAEAQVAEVLSGVEAIADATARVTASAAFSVVEALLDRELAVAESPGRDAVARALALAPTGAELTLRLNPEDVAALAADDLSSTLIKVVPDPRIASGDCLVDAGWTQVDARISTALERVRAVLGGTQ